MPAEFVEVDLTLDHAPAQVWEILGDPALYPRFVREITACEPAGTGTGRGARYRVRYAPGRGAPGRGEAMVDDIVEVLVHRRGEHLVLVGPRWQGGHFSVRLTAAPGPRTSVQVTVALPSALPDNSPLTDSYLRRRIRRALTLVDHHLSGRPMTVSPTRLDQAARGLNPLTTTRVLTRAGILNPGRPRQMARQLSALARWGPTIAGGYQAGAINHPDTVAVVDERGEFTYAAIERRTTRLANALREQGVRHGRRVALMCRNHAGLIESAVAASKLGADIVLLNTGLSADQVADIVDTHRPVALLADDEFAPLFHNLPDSLRYISTWSAAPGTLTIDGLIGAGDDTAIPPPAEAGRVIVLTSGTTGNPKGAHRPTPSGVRAATSVLSRIPLRAGERIMVAAPLFHTWGLAALQLGMTLHATLVLHRRFDAEATLRAVADYRCTSLFAVPIMLRRILSLPAATRTRYDTAALRVVASSGSALPGGLVTEFMDTYGDILYNLYGSTEVSWASIADPADLRAAPTTAGRCPVGTKVGILDADGRPQAPGVIGRICVGNAMLFEGYTHGPRPPMYDDLMATGDLGYLDADGRLHVAGRDDDMIVSGGENVFPRPVEDLLLGLDQVADAAVIGVPDPDHGQRLAAYLALKPGARLAATEVREYVRAHLERHAVPREIVFVAAVPRNATGKVVRALLPTPVQ